MIFKFLKYCLGNEVDMSEAIARMDWRQLYAFAKKQAIVGFCFDGIERLGNEYPEELKRNPIGQDLLMEWMGMAQRIRQQNLKVNMVAGKLFSQLRKDGLRCCILKGQGNALMYSEPYSRTPGDIDVWVNAERSALIEYAKKHFALGDDIRYHHLETAVDGVPVELHFMPCVMNNVVYNRRLQKWFRRNADLQCSNIVRLPDDAGEIAVPTTAFNVIYQLCHLYHHFFDEGIGMRQMIDYYYVVKSEERRVKNLCSPIVGKANSNVVKSEERRVKNLCSSIVGKANSNVVKSEERRVKNLTALRRELKDLGLLEFAGAVMYVLHEVLGLAEENMIVPMDGKRGWLLLSEIMNGGNFGKHFSKYGHFTQQGMAKKYFLKIWRNMHFISYYPAEALSEPVFRTWHFLWRMMQK